MNPFKPTAWVVAACALVLWGCPGGGDGHPDAGEPDAGTPTASLSISDAPSYDFGTRPVGLTLDRTFTVSNRGDGSASALAPSRALAAPFSFKGGSFPGTGGTCAATLAAGASCTLVVRYAPTQAGAANDTVALSYDDGLASRALSVGVKGAAVAPASLALSDGPLYDFGTTATGSTVDHTFTVTNAGAWPASALAPAPGLTGAFNFKDGAYPGTGGTCASTLAAGGTCTVVVTFAPTSPGPVTAKLALAYNDGVANQAISVDVKGDSNPAADLSISDGVTYDFGTKAIGSTNDHTFTVSNIGGLIATNLAGSGLAAPFSFKGGSYPGTGGTCGASLAPLASCTLVVTFAPTSPGTSLDTIVLDYRDGASARSATRDVRGTGITPALLSFSEAPSYDYGTRAVGTPTDYAFTLTNSGGVTATGLADALLLSGPFAFKGGSYPGTGGSCRSTLPAGSSCTVVVTFAPTSGGAFTGTLGVLYGDGASITPRTARCGLSGTGTAQAFLVLSDAPAYDFGVHATGSASDHTFTVTNTGAQAATAMSGGSFSPPFSFKGGGYPGTGGTCGTSLATGASCTVVVTFAPAAQGPASGTLAIQYNDGAANRSASVGLQGSGTNLAALVISDAPAYDFGTHAVGAGVQHTFTVTNTGAGAATGMSPGALAAPFSFRGGSYPGTGGTCGASLAAGSSCTVVVTFAPIATGSASATLSLSYQDGLSSQTATRALTGAGSTPAQLTISDEPAYDFGAQVAGSSTAHTFTVNNAGGVFATGLTAGSLGAPFSFPGGSYPGTGGTCGATLAPADSCTVVVTFAPAATGSFSDALVLSYDDGLSPQSVSRPLTGTGVAPAVVTVSDAPGYDFGSVLVGSTAEHTFTLTNTGSVPATGFSPQALAAPFAFKGGSYPGTGGTCAAGLAPGAACSVVVTFSPTAAGPASGTLGVGYSDGASSQVASRDLAGTGAAPAQLAISDGPSYDYGTWYVGQPRSHTFTVTNSGGVPATGISAGPLGLPFLFAGPYPGSGGTCGTLLAAGASCTVVVSFFSGAVGAASDTLRLNYNTGTGPASASVGLTGNAIVAAELTFSSGGDRNVADVHYFENMGVGNSVDYIVRVRNTGGLNATSLSPATLPAPFSFKGGSYPGIGGSCGTSLPRGASCLLVVTFAPSIADFASAPLALSYFDGIAVRTVTQGLEGLGVTGVSLAVTDWPPHYYSRYGVPPDNLVFNYGQQGIGGSLDHTFVVTNTGTASALGMDGAYSPSVAFPFKGGSYPGIGGTCGASLDPGASCTFVVSFTPDAPGSSSSYAGVTWGAGVQAVRDVMGTGTYYAALAIEDYAGIRLGDAFDFGTVGAGNSLLHTFIVRNTGALAATSLPGSALSAPFSYAGGAYPGTGGTCGSSLAPGATCTVVVAFTPAGPGPATGTLSLAYDDGSLVQTASRDLHGYGTDRAFLSIDAEHDGGVLVDYGTRAAGSATDQRFIVSNFGALAATGLSPASLPAPFSFKGGTYPGVGGSCAGSLAPWSTCSLVVTFAPTVAGQSAASLSLSYSDGVAMVTSVRGLVGTGTAQALLSISDYSDDANPGDRPFDYGTVGQPVDHTFYVFNRGAQAATAVTAGALPAGFTFKGGAYPGVGGTCAATLGAGASCSVVITFSPSGNTEAGGAFNLTYDNGVTPRTVSRAVVGTGTTRAVLSIVDCDGCGMDSQPANFGTVGSPTERIFYVVNTGAQAATALMDGGTLGNGFAFKGGAFPGTGGSCSTSLASGSSCTLVVTFTPSGSGPRSSTLTVSYNDGSATRSASRALAATATNRAILSISDWPNGGGGGGAFDYGVAGTPVDHTFFVANIGAQAATSLADGGTLGSGFAFKGGAYPGTGGTCGSSVASGAACTVVVTFSPSGNGSRASTLSLTYGDSQGTQSVARALSGTATTLALVDIADWPGAGGDPNPFDFGTTGQPVDHTFHVTNSGAQAATGLGDGGTLNNGFAFKGGAYPGTGGTCGSSVASGAACTVVVTFSPSGDGPRSSTLTLAYNDGASARTATRAVSGTATTFAVLNVSDCPQCGVDPNPSPVDFGTAGIPIDHTFFVLNAGGRVATALSDGGTLGGGFSFKGGSYPGTGGTCGSNLAAGDSCSVVVTFTPSGSGPRSSTLSLGYNDGAASRTATRALIGTATTRAVLGISAFPGCTTCGSDPNPFDYGTAGAPVDHTFYLLNTGAQPATALGDGATLGGDFAFKGGSYPGGGGTCGASLAPGASCTLVVTFLPSGDGPRSSTLSVAYDDGGTMRTATRPVTGTATTLALLSVLDFPQSGLNPNPFDYGTSGVPVDHTFLLVNSGAQPATALGDGFTLGGGFAFKGGSYPGTGGTCGASIAPNTLCSLVVTFTPSGDGPRSSTLTLGYNDGSATRTVTRALTGTATTLALLSVSEFPGCSNCTGPSPFDFGTYGVPVSRTLYATNSGAQPATSMGDGFTLGSGFSFRGGAYPGTGGTCGTSLATGATCVLVVTFTPSGSGPRSSTLTVRYFDGASTRGASRALAGTATTLALLGVSDFSGCCNANGPFDYGTSGIPVDHTFFLVNNGAQAAVALGDGGTLGGGFAFKGGSYPGTGGTCGTSLGAGLGCSVVVTFTPTGAGLRSSTLTVAYNDGLTTRAATRDVTGTATDRAYVVARDFGGFTDAYGPYNFGTVSLGGGFADASFTFTNSGAAAASLSNAGTLASPFQFLGGTYPGTGGTCGATLAPGQSCTVRIRFAPTFANTFMGSLTLNVADGLGPTQQASRALQGTAQ